MAKRKTETTEVEKKSGKDELREGFEKLQHNSESINMRIKDAHHVNR